MGESFRKSVIGIHNFTGYDTVIKFFNITKEKWKTPFLRCNSNIVNAITQTLCKVTKSVFQNVSKLVCSIYYSLELYADDLPSLVIECFKRIQVTVKNYQLKEQIYNIYLYRSQVQIWKNSVMEIMDFIDPLQCGCTSIGGMNWAIGTFDPTAPNCKCNCVIQRCSCNKSDLKCRMSR